MVHLKLRKPRKIISWDYSFLITLPHEWMDYNQLGKGDYVIAEIADNGNLILRPNKEAEHDKQTQ
jgi:phosphate uptake regulator